MTDIRLDENLLAELQDILEDEFPALVSTWIQDSGVRMDEVQQAFAAGNADAVRKAVHSLKGSSANVGLVCLAALCQVLEDAARAGVLAGQEGVLGRIRREREEGVVLLRDRL